VRSKDELMRLLLAHDAAAAALRAELKGRQALAFARDGSADTSRLAYGTVTANINHDRAEVVDEQAFYAWLKGKTPTEVEQVTSYVVRNPKWLGEVFLPTLAPLDPQDIDPGQATQVMYEDGELVPGVVWRRGGDLHSVSIRTDRDAVKRLAAAATLYAAGEAGPPELTS
jgi:hypothetical protein